MGHIVNPDREYRLLQQRLDRNVTGAPESPVFTKILKLLFSPEEAEFARKLPGKPLSLEILSQKLGIPPDELGDKLTDMARRGLVVDFSVRGRRYVVLAPVVIGFYEFTFMRTRDQMPMAELARLFDQYMKQDDRFARSVFQGEIQIGRSLVREEALPEGDHTEILDWERASHIVQSASAIGISLCACRHKAGHLDKACERPVEVCMTFGEAAKSIIRNGLAKTVSVQEAMKILETCKENGLAQTGDNVQHHVSYICNCCGCCCGMMEAIRLFDIRNAIVTSNWIMEIDRSRCRGCGKCAEICPVNAIDVVQESGDREEKAGGKAKWAVREASLCLGCGVCYSACKFDAISMKPREQRVYTPETMFDRYVSMAIERGKLAHLVFDDPEKLSHRALGRITRVLERSHLFKAAMSVDSLRSTFLRAMVTGAKKMSSDVEKML